MTKDERKTLQRELRIRLLEINDRIAAGALHESALSERTALDDRLSALQQAFHYAEMLEP